MIAKHELYKAALLKDKITPNVQITKKIFANLELSFNEELNSKNIDIAPKLPVAVTPKKVL